MDIEKKYLYDPFFLHTFLEEYISPNIGNDFMNSYNNFLRYCPNVYDDILKTSKIYIDEIYKFLKDLYGLNIVKDNKQKYHYYDNESSEEEEYTIKSVKGKYDINSIPHKIDDHEFYNVINIKSEYFVKSEDQNHSKYDARYNNQGILIDENVEIFFEEWLNRIVKKL